MYRPAIGEHVLGPVRGALGQAEPDHAGDHGRLHLGLGGFAMVVIAAGLSAIPRDLLEAARTDGANEWQVFRRVTVPLLAPVLTVVFITMLIYVLKVFDIVIAVAPGSVQDDANVIALAMWRTSFGGVNDFGPGPRSPSSSSSS